MRRYADVDIPRASVGKWASKYAARSGPKDDIWHGDLGEAQVRTSRQGYYGSIGFIDEQIGRILETLEKRGWMEQTLIVFTSDHGDMTGDHNLWRKSYAYEASARIPMFLRWPQGLVSAKRGQVMSQPVELRDILPTFLDAAGSTVPMKLDGASMLSLLRTDKPHWREHIDLEHGVCYSRENNWNGFTDGRMKYIYHAFHGQEQLFDLQKDPHELNGLAGDPVAEPALRQWRNRLIEHLLIRGDGWVKNGKLQTRKEPIPRSPNFPSASA
jgi:arylsulfatase A-like enzyme